MTANARLTVEQMRAFVSAVNDLVETMIVPLRGQDTPGARPVQINFNAFPVVDAAAQPAGDAS